MDLKLKDKSVLVLAAGSGIGKGAAMEFAREGARVMMAGRTGEKLKTAQEEIANETGTTPDYVVADLSRASDIASAVREAETKNGPIYALFNNTGGPKPGNFDSFTDQDWQDAFELTLLSFIRSIRAVLPSMRENGGGRIVNNTSSSFKQVLDPLLLSNVFRTGILGLSKSLARQLAPDNILVNVVAAGKIQTPRVNQVDSVKSEKQGIPLEDFQKQNALLIPMKRYGTPAEMGRLVAFLCSEANTYITGQSILVDGGMTTAY